MSSLRAGKMANDAYQRSARRALGHRPAPMQLSAGKAMDSFVSDRSALPVIPSDTKLQDSSGNALFVMGWSAIGGNDRMG